MTPPKTYLNEDAPRVLRIRITPDGRWHSLHPKDLDLEKYLESHGGHATIPLSWLLSRDHVSLTETSGRNYHKVQD